MGEEMKKIHVIDDGDWTVGMPSILTVSVEVTEEMYELMLEQKSLADFHKKLKELVEEFYQPETKYVVVDDEQERIMYEQMQEAE